MEQRKPKEVVEIIVTKDSVFSGRWTPMSQKFFCSLEQLASFRRQWHAQVNLWGTDEVKSPIP